MKLLTVLYFPSLAFLTFFLGVPAILLSTAFLITKKYCVFYPKAFVWICALKFCSTFLLHDAKLVQISSSDEKFVHWKELYSSGSLQFGDLIEFNRGSFGAL